jgi:tRNA threonylcarbamoyl adenosine modification protein YeaZ
MLLLFDTSTRTAVVALGDGTGETVLGERIYPVTSGGSAQLLTGALGLLTDQGAGLEDLIGVVVDRGPGSYTGLRIGYALAQGLAETRGIPLAGVPSFEAFAMTHREDHRALIVCFEARSRGIAWVTFPKGSDRTERVGEEPVLRPGERQHEILEWEGQRSLVRFAPPDALPGLIPRPCRAVGPGVDRLSSTLNTEPHNDLELVTGTGYPEVAALLRAGARRLERGGENPARVEPLYLGTMEPPARGV